MLNLKIKKLNELAIIPSYANDGSNGLDITGISVMPDFDNHILSISTGIAVEIPEGCAGYLLPRSSLYKLPFVLCNSVGLIDSNYRGEISFKFKYIGEPSRWWDKLGYKVGERIGQLVVLETPKVFIKEVKELSETNRGVNGWGSTGV